MGGCCLQALYGAASLLSGGFSGGTPPGLTVSSCVLWMCKSESELTETHLAMKMHANECTFAG